MAACNPALESCTKRLNLRSLRTSDAEEIYRICSEEITIKMPPSESWVSTDATRETIERMTSLPNSHAMSVSLRSTDADAKKVIIGVIGLHSGESKSLVYRFSRDFWSQGYCTEALTEFMRLLFEKQPERKTLRADVLEQNVGSQRVLQKCGFQQVKLHERERPELKSDELNELREASKSLADLIGVPPNMKDVREGLGSNGSVERATKWKWTHWEYNRSLHEE